jgi:hypothetical protein
VADSIARVVNKRRLHESDHAEELRYWLSRSVDERIAQVTRLRSEAFSFDDTEAHGVARVVTKFRLKR